MKKERPSLLDLLNGYEVPRTHRNEKGDPITGKTFFSRSFSGKVGGRRARVLPKLFGAVKKGIKMLVYTSTRVYGTLLLLFGAFATIARLIMDYIGFEDAWNYSALAAGLLMILIGVLLMLVDKPLGIALEDFPLTDYVLFEFFCIKRMQKSALPPRGYPSPVAIIAAALLAAVGTFLHPGYVVLAIVAVLFSLLALASPEFSFLFTIIALPFVDFFDRAIFILTFLLVMTVISFIRKVMSGKRVYVFEQYDLLIGLMLVFVLTSGIFIKGIESFESSVMLVLGAMGYVLASNLVTNRRLADRFTLAVMICALPASVYAIARFTLGAIGGDFVYDGDGFYSSGSLGAFLLVSVLFTLSNLIESKRAGERVVYSVFLVFSGAALGCILNYAAYIAIAFSIAAYFILKLRKFSGVALALLCLLPYAVFLIPSELLRGEVAERLLGMSIDEHSALWRGALEIFSEHPFFGIGMGADAFSSEIARFGISAENSANLFLELACEAGVFALFAFVLVLAAAARHRGAYRSYVKHSQVRTASKTAAVVSVTLIAYSTVFYIWESAAVCFIFWCVLGFGSASLRIAKREHDDRIIYYNDIVSSESSDVDVQIDGFTTKK